MWNILHVVPNPSPKDYYWSLLIYWKSNLWHSILYCWKLIEYLSRVFFPIYGTPTCSKTNNYFCFWSLAFRFVPSHLKCSPPLHFITYCSQESILHHLPWIQSELYHNLLHEINLSFHLICSCPFIKLFLNNSLCHPCPWRLNNTNPLLFIQVTDEKTEALVQMLKAPCRWKFILFIHILCYHPTIT